MQNGKIKEIWNILNAIPDPEIPVISIVELGVVRNVELYNKKHIISITPTYSGCPATEVFKNDIKKNLEKNNIDNIEIRMVYSPAWTTDWINNDAKNKLKKYGIAPPEKNIKCPQCNSIKIELISEFSSTACKSLYKCTSCLEPFEYFKCI